MTIGDWTERFQGTQGLPRATRDRLLQVAHLVHAKAGTTMFDPDHLPNSLLFLVEGTLRVSQTSDNGREIVLYRVEAGESCVLTTACILTEEAYNASGLAETDVLAVALPRQAFDRLVAEEPAFRSFVFAAYSRRLVDLLRVVDDVAFGKIDVRLADRITQLGDGLVELAITHQDLATELGTAREVISRQLNEFQRRGWIAQSRGRIRFLDRAALRDLAQA